MGDVRKLLAAELATIRDDARKADLDTALRWAVERLSAAQREPAQDDPAAGADRLDTLARDSAEAICRQLRGDPAQYPATTKDLAARLRTLLDAATPPAAPDALLPGLRAARAQARHIRAQGLSATTSFDLLCDWLDDRGGDAALTTAPSALAQAIEGVLTGGNHLVAHLGQKHPPHDATDDDALAYYGAGWQYDAWAAWSRIMRLSAAWRGA